MVFFIRIETVSSIGKENFHFWNFVLILTNLGMYVQYMVIS